MIKLIKMLFMRQTNANEWYVYMDSMYKPSVNEPSVCVCAFLFQE